MPRATWPEMCLLRRILKPCNRFHFDNLSQGNHRNSSPSAIHRQPCARTYNGSVARGPPVRLTGTGMRSMPT
jgi:hypothetical protein